MPHTKEYPKAGSAYAASIDIGTNTARFLVGEILPNRNNFRIVHSGGAITRLGKGMSRFAELSKNRMLFAASVLSDFHAQISPYNPEFISAEATSAVREASNNSDFLNLVRKETGMKIRIIDWKEEALRTLLGVCWNCDPRERENFMIFDVGGGSTEFIVGQGQNLVDAYGSDLGVVHLAEMFITSDPLNETDLKNLRDFINKKVLNISERFGGNDPKKIICTAGTPTTLAAAQLKMSPYDPDQIHNFRISRAQVQKIFEDLRGLPIEKRKKLPWIEEGRADIILPGAQIVLSVMEIFGMDEMTVSEYGLREGILLYALKEKMP